jgi:GR25 family glycosyltransferase involved in LPS biosynthesis
MNKLENFPTSYYVTLEESVDRQKNIVNQFEKYGISPIPIVSKRFSESNDIVTGKYLHQLNAGTAGCCVSHLKAIKNWYESTSEDYAFFFEDDLSLETVKYWDFTWEEFIEIIPEDAECVQLLTVRGEYDTFELRERLWNDWAATAYIITRDYAKKIIDSYIKEDHYFLEIPNQEIMPLVENVLFTSLGKVYTIPLFVENVEFNSTFSKEQDDDVNSGQKNNHKTAHSIVSNYWKSKVKKYNIVDCFPYFNEKELLELRINLLKDYVDLFVIIDGNYTHSGDPKSFTCRDVIEDLDLPKDKIQLIELNMSDDIILNSESKIESREAFQRDAIKNILDQFDDDTVFIVSDCDEIIDPKNINFLSNIIKTNQCILKIPLVLLEGRADLRVYHKDGEICEWDSSFMCLKKHLEQTSASHIRLGFANISYVTQDSQILLDLGWHFTWMQSPEDRVYKFQSFCHANDDLKLITNADYSKEEHIEFMKSYIPKEGEITPYGDVDKILKKYPTENLPVIIWNLPRVKNYLLPENEMMKTEIEELLTTYSLDTENPEHNFNLGIWYENEGHTASALSYFLRCAERSEDTNLTYEALIRGSYCYKKQRERDGSTRSLLWQAQMLRPDRPEAYYLLSNYAEEREWWQDCYVNADLALRYCNFDQNSLRTDVGYPGKYGLLFEKAISGWWWGKNEECKNILLDLKDNCQLPDGYRNIVIENLKKIGIEIEQVNSKEDQIYLSGIFDAQKYNTDKNHLGYFENFYDEFFNEIKNTPVNLLEIGVYNGGSIKLWKDYLHSNSKIYAGDINYFDYIEGTYSIIGDMYSSEQVSKFEDEYFDVIIDDGPHSFESFVLVMQRYFSKIKKGGTLIIEDIIVSSWVVPLVELSASLGYSSCEVIDMTGKQKTQELLNRWKDGLFILKIVK